jgi:hypothetical protein
MAQTSNFSLLQLVTIAIGGVVLLPRSFFPVCRTGLPGKRVENNTIAAPNEC